MTSPNDECTYSDYKLCFTLKQHTPIIHFQANQSGATLRATELKPKLDRFLIKKLELTYIVNNKIVPKDEHKSWFVGEGKNHLALDYKVKVEEYNDEKPLIYESSFIGNMEDNGKKKYEKFSKGIVRINIFTFNSSLRSEIKRYINQFLLSTNFGTNTSKGYGCFYLYDEVNNKYVEADFSFVDKKVYSFTSTKENVIRDIGYINSLFRNGYNIKNDIYVKSILFSYLEATQYYRYDKKYLKYKFSPTVNVTNDKKATLARDLFGLSLRQEWKVDHDGLIITKNDPLNNITRFKSPIIYKSFIIDDIEPKATSKIKVYFWANDSYKSLLSKRFCIYSNLSDTEGTLKFPHKFDFEHFFAYIANDYYFTVDSKFHKSDKYQALSNILTDIKESNNE